MMRSRSDAISCRGAIFDKLFSVFYNARNFATDSALLKNDDEGDDRVISYLSRLLKAVELVYPINFKELLSIKYALVKP